LKKILTISVLAFGFSGIYFFANDSDIKEVDTEEIVERKKLVIVNKKDDKRPLGIKREEIVYKQYTPQKINSSTEQKATFISIAEIYNNDNLDISSKVTLIKKYQEEALEWALKSKKEPKRLVTMKPEMVLTLALVLDESMDNILNDSFTIKVELPDMYVIKTFSESKDFHILVSQDRLNIDNVNLPRLREIYSNPGEKIEDLKTGIIIGEPSSAPSAPPPEDEDNDS
jgi:hypothetical protein